LGVEARINEWTKANILFKAEDIGKYEDDGSLTNTSNAARSDNDEKPFIDEAFVTIFNPAKCPFYAILGKRAQPFGQLFTHTISDPVTKDAYEISTTGATVGYAPADFFGLDASLTVYKGEKVMGQLRDNIIGPTNLANPGRNSSHAETDDVSSYIASLSAKPVEALTIGVAFDSEPGDNNRNETLNLFAEFSMADVTVDAEYFKATKREKLADNMAYKENAWVLGVAYQIMERLELALRYENFDNDRSVAAGGDFDHTIVFGANYDLFENVTLMGEYRNLKEKAAAGSTYEESVNEFNLRVAVGF
nr:LbtU family siderophore porin [Candidatus Desulfatibia profunda]